MGIKYNLTSKTFNLESKNTSYIMKVLPNGNLMHLYWGRKINSNNIDYSITNFDRDRGSFVANKDNIENFGLEITPQEYPSYGNTDLRSPAVQIELEDGSRITDFRFDSYKIYKGKEKINGLPATYIEDGDSVETLEIKLKDTLYNLEVILSYSVYEDYDAITRTSKIINNDKQKIKILRALSGNVDFSGSDFDLINLSGAWGRERHIVRRELKSGSQSIESRRGASSHVQNPFIALVDKNVSEDNGDVYGFNLIYSGNFLANVEVDLYNNARVQIGINPFDFSWTLESNEEFQCPEVVMVYSKDGLTGMTHIYHDLYRERLCRGTYRDKERPILINNWEATYFNFDSEKIINIAKDAKELGIELLVLDDGWFGERNDDKSSLGDWFVNEEKLQGGLKSLCKNVNDIGLKFGLWFEPEMISPKSKLYEKHPDWCIHVEGRNRSEGRAQLVLDLSRKEVCDEIIKRISDILSSVPIEYVKWDMNRNITEVGSKYLPRERQMEVAHRYMLGLYRILEEITSKFPNILFESCSGGGGRFDGGMLYYMPQTWTSDDTDAIERLKIQFGTSLVYPSITMGSHVSAIPNHQVYRITLLKTRGVVAMAGNLGYELDLNVLNDRIKEEVKEQVEFYKSMRKTVQFGDFYRLKNPFEGNEAAWMHISKDKKEALVSYVKKNAEVNVLPRKLKLKGLEENAKYKVSGIDRIFGGDELMYLGLNIPELDGDYRAYDWVIRKVE